MSEIYPAGDHQITPNLGLGLWGTDEVTSDNFILIDTAFGSVSGAVKVNNVSVPNPNFINSASATFSVAGSNISLATIPGGVSGNIQGNNLGVFGGMPGSTIDFTNGTLIIAPTGDTSSHPALSIFCDSIGNDVLRLFQWHDGLLLSVSGVGEVTLTPTNGVSFTATGASDGSDILDLFIHGGAIPAVAVNSLGSLIVNKTLTDGSASVGTSGQVLSSTVTGVAWTNAAAAPSTNLLMSQFGPAANGVTDDSAVFVTAMAALSEIWLDAGKSYFIGTNLILTSNFRFLAGAKIIIGNGVTLTVNGKILSPDNQQIFTASQSTQTFSYGFTSVENPLSDGGAFTAWGGAANTGKVASSGVYEPTANSTFGAALYTTPGTSTASQYAEVTIGNAATGNNVYAIVRGLTTGTAGQYTGYTVFVSGMGNGANISLYRYTLGTGVLLWTSTAAGGAGTGINVAVGDKLRLAVQTNAGGQAVLSVFYNGTLQTTYTDTALASLLTGYAGCGVYSTTAITAAQLSLFATGTSNVGTVLIGPNNPQVYPEWFGAVGDGSTNDAPAIQLAINSISSQGLGAYYASTAKSGIGTVVLSSKIYAVQTALQIQASGVNIIGQGPANSTLLWTGSTTSDVLQLTGTTSAPCSFNILQNFGVGSSVATGTNSAGVRYTNTLVVYTFNVYSFDRYNCFYQQSGNLEGQGHFRDCQAGSNLQSSASINSGFYFTTTNGTFDSTRVEECLVANCVNGFYVTGAGIADIFFDGCETAGCNYGHYFISTYHTPGQFINDNIHCVRCIHDGCNIGISINNVYGASAYIDIDSCYVAGSAAFPLIDIENSSGVNVRGCDIRTHGTSTTGILVNGANSNACVIEGNQFTVGAAAATIAYAIGVSGCSNIVIANNAINGPSASFLFTIGIKCVSATYVLIQGNSLSGYFTTGVSLDSGSSHCGGVNSLNLAAGTPIIDSGTSDTVTSI